MSTGITAAVLLFLSSPNTTAGLPSVGCSPASGRSKVILYTIPSSLASMTAGPCGAFPRCARQSALPVSIPALCSKFGLGFLCDCLKIAFLFLKRHSWKLCTDIGIHHFISSLVQQPLEFWVILWHLVRPFVWLTMPVEKPECTTLPFALANCIHLSDHMVRHWHGCEGVTLKDSPHMNAVELYTALQVPCRSQRDSLVRPWHYLVRRGRLIAHLAVCPRFYPTVLLVVSRQRRSNSRGDILSDTPDFTGKAFIQSTMK